MIYVYSDRNFRSGYIYFFTVRSFSCDFSQKAAETALYRSFRTFTRRNEQHICSENDLCGGIGKSDKIHRYCRKNVSCRRYCTTYRTEYSYCYSVHIFQHKKVYTRCCENTEPHHAPVLSADKRSCDDRHNNEHNTHRQENCFQLFIAHFAVRESASDSPADIADIEAHPESCKEYRGVDIKSAAEGSCRRSHRPHKHQPQSAASSSRVTFCSFHNVSLLI